MPTDTIPGNLGTPRLLSDPTKAGTDLTTTPVFIAVPPSISNIILVPRNFTGAAAVKISLNPWITILSTLDAMATNGSDQSANAQDGVAGSLVTLSSLPTLANGGAVYIGANQPFSALQADVASANGNGGTMAVHYWNGSAWTNITPTDNTANFANDGSITWTVPTDWVQTSIQVANDQRAPRTGTALSQYWVRLSTSAAYDASTTLASLYALAELGQSGGMQLPDGERFQQYGFRGNISASTDAGTANLIVNGFENS